MLHWSQHCIRICAEKTKAIQDIVRIGLFQVQYHTFVMKASAHSAVKSKYSSCRISRHQVCGGSGSTIVLYRSNQIQRITFPDARHTELSPDSHSMVALSIVRSASKSECLADGMRRLKRCFGHCHLGRPRPADELRDPIGAATDN